MTHAIFFCYTYFISFVLLEKMSTCVLSSDHVCISFYRLPRNFSYFSIPRCTSHYWELPDKKNIKHNSAFLATYTQALWKQVIQIPWSFCKRQVCDLTINKRGFNAVFHPSSYTQFSAAVVAAAVASTPSIFRIKVMLSHSSCIYTGNCSVGKVLPLLSNHALHICVSQFQ